MALSCPCTNTGGCELIPPCRSGVDLHPDMRASLSCPMSCPVLSCPVRVNLTHCTASSLQVSKGSVNVFSKTMLASMKLLYMLMFMMFLVTLVAGALLYYLERGRWNPILGIYERHGYYLCPVDDPADAGEDVRRSLLSDSLICERSESGYMCQYSWLRDPSCKPVYQPGPFISIWHATWFVMQTITTVGFGNDNPTSALGLTLSAGIIMFGMLVVSLPITVIGSNFSSTYKNHQRMLVQLKDEVHYQDMSLLKKFTYKLMYS